MAEKMYKINMLVQLKILPVFRLLAGISYFCRTISGNKIYSTNLLVVLNLQKVRKKTTVIMKCLVKMLGLKEDDWHQTVD